jgi:undecaprenyl-diphosphatase
MGRLHVYAAIFGVVLSTLIVPLPEEMALLGAGWLAHGGQATLWGAFLASWLAIVVGDTTTFFIGRLFLHRLLKTRFGRRLVKPEQRRWAEAFVARQGWRAILLGRFLVALRGPVYLAVDASKYSPAKFIAINSSVALAEVGLVVWLGYRFGQSGALVGKVRWIDAAVAASVIIAFLIPWLFSRWLRRRPARA